MSLESDYKRISLDELYEKYNSICWICKKFVPRDQASRDHIVPLSLGGGHEPENFALAHKKCNNKRGNDHRVIHFKTYETLDTTKDVTILTEEGLLVQVWRDPYLGGMTVVVSKKVRESP